MSRHVLTGECVCVLCCVSIGQVGAAGCVDATRTRTPTPTCMHTHTQQIRFAHHGIFNLAYASPKWFHLGFKFV